MDVAAPHKKTHLIGATEFASDNKDLELTLHHNYYKDSQDRMPRLRGGNAHIYNIVMDSRDANKAKSIISSSLNKQINSAGYHFGITSNGALSTEGGALLLENSQILGVSSPLRNNQKSASKTEYTGKILALDTIYKYKDIDFRGSSIEKNSPLSPEPAKALDFSWNGQASI
ncbi:MAG: polysaccharide lyase [Clostridium sp.]|nr:polysaccharide lyase [Clostridium sp.]